MLGFGSSSQITGPSDMEERAFPLKVSADLSSPWHVCYKAQWDGVSSLV